MLKAENLNQGENPFPYHPERTFGHLIVSNQCYPHLCSSWVQPTEPDCPVAVGYWENSRLRPGHAQPGGASREIPAGEGVLGALEGQRHLGAAVDKGIPGGI